MSKAFTREDTEGEDDDLPPGVQALPVGARNYVTPAGFEKLRAEHERLLRVERPDVVRTVSWAAANGDRSENGDYLYGKRRLREIDGRVRFLRKRLDGMVVVDQPPADRDRVFFGAWVEVEDAAGATTRHRIVGPDEHDRQPDYLSMDGPLGRALMGKRLDDEVTVDTPRGPRRLIITAIAYD